MDELLEKCQRLLKPIRDLEQNWSVDLANELTQAILSLDEQMVSFGQNGDKIIDFSKAAMIIQGSAHVYSKKVDYLYKTVYEMKEWMEKLWEAEKKSRGRNKNTGDVGVGLDLDADDEEDDLDFSSIKEQDTRLDETKMADQIEGLVLLPPKPSNLAGTFNLKIPLKSISEDVIGYMNDFFINSIDVYSLVYSHGTAIENADAPEINEEPVEADAPEVPEGCADDSPSDGEVFPVAESPELPHPAEDDPSDTPIRMDKQTRALRPRTMQAPSPTPQQAAIDPWTQVLDPHSTDLSRLSKTLAPGNCRVLPPSLRKGKKRKAGANHSADTSVNDIAAFCDKEYSRFGPNAGSHLLFPELKHLFADALKRRLIKLRRLRKPIRLDAEEDHEQDDVNLLGIGCDLNPLEDCINDNADDGDNDEIPYSRFVGESEEATGASPLGYSEFLAKMLQERYEDLATQSDRLTEIDKKVKAWENSVRDALELTEARPAFDMLHYTANIFNSFTGDDDSILMDQLLEGKPKYEAFRTFVSTLILANHGNIEILDDHEQVRVSLKHKTTLSDVIAADVTSCPAMGTVGT